MNIQILKSLLDSVANQTMGSEQAIEQLKNWMMEDVDFAHIDHHRSLRKGFPEVIYGESKTAEQIIGILKRMIPQEQVILITRVDAAKADSIHKVFDRIRYDSEAKIIVWQETPLPKTGLGTILIISAGTSDIPVAREAALTADAMGNTVQTIFDVGVAGIHRLFAHKDMLQQARVVIVVAGMEGALPSVVAGMICRPVIAVPTSVGYGVNLGGLTALFGMLSSCSSNVAVVNIDNGFGAGYMASCINQP